MNKNHVFFSAKIHRILAVIFLCFSLTLSYGQNIKGVRKSLETISNTLGQLQTNKADLSKPKNATTFSKKSPVKSKVNLVMNMRDSLLGFVAQRLQVSGMMEAKKLAIERDKKDSSKSASVTSSTLELANLNKQVNDLDQVISSISRTLIASGRLYENRPGGQRMHESIESIKVAVPEDADAMTLASAGITVANAVVARDSDTTKNATGTVETPVVPEADQGGASEKGSENDAVVKALKKSVDDAIKELRKQSIVTFQISIGPRWLTKGSKDNYHDAFLDPEDSSLVLEKLDRTSFLISSGISITPFIQETDWVKSQTGIWRPLAWFAANLGVQCNINLLEISNSGTSFPFNKGIDGGIGLSLHVGHGIFFGITREFFLSKQPRDLFKQRVGQKLYKEGNIISVLNKEDELFYTNRTMQGTSFHASIGF